MNSLFVIFNLISAVFGIREKMTILDREKSESGTIHSKDFPYSYNPTEIEIFDFRGREQENVQITFEYFNLYPKTTNERCGIESSFITYKKYYKNEWEKLCGDKKPLPIMSEGNNFILRYEPITVPLSLRDRLEQIGFNATYRFVRNFGVDYKVSPNDDRLNDPFGHRCDFLYDSEYYPSGTISSPNFPGVFPDPIRCMYTLFGKETNILLQFTHFNLSGSQDCNEELDRKDKLQIISSLNGDEDNKAELCGQWNPFNYTITNRTAFLIYTHNMNFSDNYLAGSDFVGFNVTFLFTNDTINTNSACDHRLSGTLFFCVCLYLILHQCLHF